MSTAMKLEKPGSVLRGVVDQGGFSYACLFALRWLVYRALRPVDRTPALAQRRPFRAIRRRIGLLEARMVGIERERNLVAPWAVANLRFTARDNRTWWNTHDWSRLGEEWTPSEEWKKAVVSRYLAPYMPEGVPLLEIGPGGGRWTGSPGQGVGALRRRCRRSGALGLPTPIRTLHEHQLQPGNRE
nr:hypothetical protein [Gemmatimonadales bacterium]